MFYTWSIKSAESFKNRSLKKTNPKKNYRTEAENNFLHQFPFLGFGIVVEIPDGKPLWVKDVFLVDQIEY